MTSSRRQQIRDAIEALHASGAHVSATTIRDRLGGGSYSTISDEIQRWRAALGAKPADSAMRVREVGLELFKIGSSAAELAEGHQDAAAAASVAAASLDFMRAKEAEASFLRQALEAAAGLAETLQSEILVLREEVSRLTKTNEALNEQLVGLSRDAQKKLDASMAGFDGMQRRLMLMLDQARQQAQAPIQLLREQVQQITTQLNAKTQQANEALKLATVQAETIRNLESRLHDLGEEV